MNKAYDYNKYIWQIQFRARHAIESMYRRKYNTIIDPVNRMVILHETDTLFHETNTQYFEITDEAFAELLPLLSIQLNREFELLPEEVLIDQGYRDGWSLRYTYFTKENPPKRDGALMDYLQDDPLEEVVNWLHKHYCTVEFNM